MAIGKSPVAQTEYDQPHAIKVKAEIVSVLDFRYVPGGTLSLGEQVDRIVEQATQGDKELRSLYIEFPTKFDK